ncbi:hypothetical protein ACS0TY_019822 [Phlomoides rotata]
MDPFHRSCIKLFTLLCLLSWSSGAASTAVPLLSPPSSATLAADTLRSRGYSIFASLIVSITTTTNFSGTLLAPPDFAFSFASAKILNKQRPSVPLLLYHTLSPPLILTWAALASRDDGDELRTFYNNNCLYLLRNSFGEVSISASPFKNPITAVVIRQPDLYVDEHLTVHGIDGALDPSFATKCSVPYIEPTADAVPRQMNRIFLDRAMRGLWRKGYNVVAAAMAIRRSELLSLTSVTVFAVSDETLFMKPDGFRYDFRHHVVPIRQRFADLEKSGRLELFTLAPNKTVVVETVDGAVNVDGVAMKMVEVYHNRWIVVLSVISSLDDVADYHRNPKIATNNLVPSPAPFSIVSTKGSLPKDSRRVPSPSPFSSNSADEDSSKYPSPAPWYIPSWAIDSESPSPAPAPSSESPSSSPSPTPEIEVAKNPVSHPRQSPAIDDITVTNCHLNDGAANVVEGGDLLCPITRAARQLLSDVERSRPCDAHSQDADSLTKFYKAKIAENVNIADDVFFYI